MGGHCELKLANGMPEEPCDDTQCVFWRLVGHLGTEQGDGCAIKHFELLGNDGVAEWLLSVKQRVEQASEDGTL